MNKEALDETLSIRKKKYFGTLRSVLQTEENNFKECTDTLFKLFCDTINSNEHQITFEDNLKILANFFNCQLKNLKYDGLNFFQLVVTTFPNLQIEYVWWLHTNNLIAFAEYCYSQTPTKIIEELFKLLERNKSNKIFDDEIIVKDIIIIILSGVFAPNYNLNLFSKWFYYCQNILTTITNKCIENMYMEKPNYLFERKEIFSADRHLYSYLYKKLFRNILRELMLNKNEKCDIYSAYKYQHLFSTKFMSESQKIVYNSIFSFNDLNDIITIMNENSDVNFKYTLFALNICMRRYPECIKEITKLTIEYLNANFRSGKIFQLMKAFIIIRQVALESKDKYYYQNWYSKMFGNQTNYITSTVETIFKQFINSLSILIPHEPKYILNIHLKCALRAPPKCNSLIFDYKNLCKIRMENLISSPSFILDNEDISILHLIEDCNRLKEVTWVLHYFKSTQKDAYQNLFLPQLLRSEDIFVNVKKLLLELNFMSITQFNNVNMPTEKILTYDDDDDLFE